jgi:hypothetical protein
MCHVHYCALLHEIYKKTYFDLLKKSLFSELKIFAFFVIINTVYKIVVSISRHKLRALLKTLFSQYSKGILVAKLIILLLNQIISSSFENRTKHLV